MDHAGNLADLKQAGSHALAWLLAEQSIGVAHHRLDVLLLEPSFGRYLGRLCNFGSCPKGKPECRAAGCGRSPLLRQHDGFALHPAALAEGRAVRLYVRYRPAAAP